jgi:hypothetical protein
MQNTAGKKRAGQEDVDSDYLFGDRLQRRTYGSRASVRVPAHFVSKRGPAGVVISRNTRLLVQRNNSMLDTIWMLSRQSVRDWCCMRQSL